MSKIAVMGAGAVGCYFGGLLARAGHDVVLIGRPAHVEAIRRDGLRLQTATLDVQVPLQADTEPAAARGAGLVMFCVKSTDTESAGAQLREHLAPDALVLSMQNGVDNAPRLRRVLGAQPVSATVVYVAAGMAGPGHVRHHGRGELLIEPAAGDAAAARLLSDSGIPTTVSENVAGALWAKLVVNCAYNALSAIGQVDYGHLAQDATVRQLMHDIVEECLAVAQADGVQGVGDGHLGVRRIAETMPTQRSSTAQDLARGKPTEIDHLNGYVVRRGEALGVPTPANRALQVAVQLLERRTA
jgi:2-dehydropantoate 2-reductase